MAKKKGELRKIPCLTVVKTSSHSPMMGSIDDGTLSGFAVSKSSMRVRATSIRSAYYSMRVRKKRRREISSKSTWMRSSDTRTIVVLSFQVADERVPIEGRKYTGRVSTLGFIDVILNTAHENLHSPPKSDYRIVRDPRRHQVAEGPLFVFPASRLHLLP